MSSGEVIITEGVVIIDSSIKSPEMSRKKNRNNFDKTFEVRRTRYGLAHKRRYISVTFVETIAALLIAGRFFPLDKTSFGRNDI